MPTTAAPTTAAPTTAAPTEKVEQPTGTTTPTTTAPWLVPALVALAALTALSVVVVALRWRRASANAGSRPSMVFVPLTAIGPDVEEEALLM